jgi:hypothetical protein
MGAKLQKLEYIAFLAFQAKMPSSFNFAFPCVLKFSYCDDGSIIKLNRNLHLAKPNTVADQKVLLFQPDSLHSLR